MLWIVLLALVACGGDGDGSTGDKDAAPTDDSSPSPDSSTMPPDASFGPGALCGMTTCATTEGCCTGSMISCKAVADCPTQHFECDGPEDCGGGPCCFGNGGQGGSECRAAGASCGDVACHFDNDCGGSTPKCCPRPFSPSYGVCAASC